jgi:hypothetical protein
MNAVIRRISFAPGNFVTAKAFANDGPSVADFTATSRLIDTIKVGPDKVDAVQITAIDRPPSDTRAKTYDAREITLIVPKDYPLGKHALSNSGGVAASYKNGDAISEGISGEIEIKAASDQKNVAATFKIIMENADETKFQLNGEFQVLK